MAFCMHKFKKVKPIKVERREISADIVTWLCVCEKCGKEKTVKE